MKTHIAFDFDDTITASYLHNQDILVDNLKAHFPNIDDSLIRDIHYSNRGLPMFELFKIIRKKLNIEFDQKEIFDDNLRLHSERIKQVRVFPGFPGFLKSLKANKKKIYIVSNRDKSTIIPVLKNYKIDSYFEEVISCIDEGFEKPDPTTLLNLIKKEEKTKKDFLYIGDSKTDAEFATRANVDFIIIDHYLNLEKFYQRIVGLFI
ncbi:HAD-IA family hydrolase [Candidatus Dojkabacteria bacterium]|nr:HAD-IA family hydrolase [Candidatus Dojkabacteria bacterium]